jgi:flagellar hook-length control protein FliK
MTQTDYALQNLIQTVQTAPSASQTQRSTSTDKSEKGSDFQSLLQQKSQDSAPTDAPVQTQETADSGKAETVIPQANTQKQEETLPQELACAQLLAQIVVPTTVQPQQTQAPEEQAAVAAVETTPTVVSAQELAFRQLPAESVQEQAEQPAAEAVQDQIQQPTQTQTQAPEVEAASVQQQVQQPAQATQQQSMGQEQTDRQGEDVSYADTEKEEPRVEVTDAPTGGQQLFQNVETTMIKVAEAPAAESTAQTAPVEKQIADQLTQALDQGESKVEVKLTPESLGSVTVEVTQQKNGTLSVVLTAESDHTRALLTQHMGNLQELLGAQGQKDVQIQVARQQESQQSDPSYDGRNDAQNGQSGQQQEQRQQQARQDQDFLQQLRLGLIPLDAEAS